MEVTPSPHEFTLDFVRMDYALGDPPRRGIVVARVAVSPLFVLSLIEVLEAKWASYAENTTRREVWGGEEDETEGRGTGDDPAV